MIDLTSAINFLLDNEYLTVVNGKLVITNKLHRETKLKVRERVEVLFPDQPTLITREAIWNKFITDACIPYQAEGSSGRKYTIRQYSSGLADELIKIIKSVDYKILVESTKRYYNTATYKLILSNYIRKNVWKEEYKRYEEGLKSNSLAYGQGGNAWES